MLSALHSSRHGDFYFFYIGSQQGQCGECCRTDGKAFARGSRGIAECIECVCAVAHLLAQLTHFSVAAGVVGDRAVSVRSERDAQRGQHSDSRNADTVESFRDALSTHREIEMISAEITQHNGHTDSKHGDARGNHTRTDTFDDDRGRSSLGRFGNSLGGLITMRGVILCGLSDDDARRETTDDGETEAYPVVEAETIKDEERGEGNQHSAGIGADGQ